MRMCPGMPNNCLACAEPSSAEWLPTLTSFLPLPLPLLPQNNFPLAAAFILNLVAAAAKVTHATCKGNPCRFFGTQVQKSSLLCGHPSYHDLLQPLLTRH